MRELTLTRHADQRKLERFVSDRDLQEFHRAIQSEQDCLVCNQSLLVMQLSRKNISFSVDSAGVAIICVSEGRDGKGHLYEDSHRGLIHEIIDVDRLVTLMDE